MKRKISIWFLILATAIIILPPAASARGTSPSERNSATNYEYSGFPLLQGRGRGRGRNRSWNRNRWNRGRYYRNTNRRTRLVRQVYWRNGRRYVRYVRVYYR